MKRLIGTLLLALPLFAFAAGPEKNAKEETHTTTLQGTIGDVSNYQPLGDVELTLTSTSSDLKKVVKTDEQGKFLITDIPAGTYQVKFVKNGYEPGAYPTLTVRDGAANSFGFLLFEE